MRLINTPSLKGKWVLKQCPLDIILENGAFSILENGAFLTKRALFWCPWVVPPPPDKEAFINYVRGLYHLTGKILVIHFVISPVKRVYNFVILPIENYENFVIPLTCKENWKPAIILLKFITFEVYHLTIICWEVCYTVLAVCFSLYIMEW